MSDRSRYPSSPPSSNSGRPIPSLARPDWPWARNYSHRSRQGSPNPSFSSQSGWDSSGRASGSTSTTQVSYSGSHLARTSFAPRVQAASSTHMMSVAESTRQWSFTGFEWDIHDLRKLKDFVEDVEPSEQPGDLSKGDVEDFEILTKSPMLGDGKFKLEIVSPVRLSTKGPGTLATLSLYITTLMLDYAEDDFELHTSMMVAIKCQGDRIGERGARPDWVWEFWQNDWVFRRENEVWECPLPPLSKLLEHPRIQETDSLVICVQIHSPVGPSIPQHPSVYHVPRNLLDGLEASLDNPNTGDVRFVCLEKCLQNQIELSDVTNVLTPVHDPFSSHPTARKRIIYAHSDILIRRSDYFATMLSSSFSENSVVASTGERKFYTVIVEEADFVTIYWLLKYCYANWLLFKQNDDPRAAVEGVGAGWSARWLHGQHNEWEWKPFHRGGSSEDDIADNRSATSGESVPAVSSAVSRSVSKKSEIYHQQPTTAISPLPKTNSAKSSSLRVNSTSSSAAPGTGSSHDNRRNNSTRVGATQSPVQTGTSPPGVIPRSQTIAVPSSKSFPAMAAYPNSARTQKNLKPLASPDPHPHPTPPPPPASALSIYQVAHRYIMPSLAALALEHIMSTITPESSFAILLATVAWDDLHSLVEDYVVDKWDDVCISKEFEDCCNEVAAGEWGVDGGQTLMSVFRRLRSPGP